MTNVAIINQTTLLTDEQIAPLIHALQTQVTSHFFPYWGVNANIVQVKKGGHPPKGAWWLVLMDNSDQAGALGYHDVTAEGLPLGKAFVKSELDGGTSWTTTVSHELLEMLADPDISRAVEWDGNNKTIFYALEVADPCEADEYAYLIGQVLVSDFVLPGYYHEYRNYPHYDYTHHIKNPLQVLPGGYISFFDPSTGKGWQQIDAKSQPSSDPKARARVGSRRERRSIPRSSWVRSTAHKEDLLSEV